VTYGYSVCSAWFSAPQKGANASISAFSGGALDDLSDVAITIPEDGDVLTYHQGSGMWVSDVAPAGGGGASELDDLDDVAITGRLGRCPRNGKRSSSTKAP
jgi:hypothetical protein